MSFRKYFTALVFIILLIWGPVDSNQHMWFVIRGGYLIVIPLLVHIITYLIWNYLEISSNTDWILCRVFFGGVSIFFFYLTYIYGTAEEHISNTQRVMTRDGWEDVGEDIVLPGADYGAALVWVVLGVIFLRIAFQSNKSKNSNK